MTEIEPNPPGTQETNHELFPSLPIGCSESLDGKHNYVRDEDTRINMPGNRHMIKSYFSRSGNTRCEVFNGLCACGDVKEVVVPV